MVVMKQPSFSGLEESGVNVLPIPRYPGRRGKNDVRSRRPSDGAIYLLSNSFASSSFCLPWLLMSTGNFERKHQPLSRRDQYLTLEQRYGALIF